MIRISFSICVGWHLDHAIALAEVLDGQVAIHGRNDDAGMIGLESAFPDPFIADIDTGVHHELPFHSRKKVAF